MLNSKHNQPRWWRSAFFLTAGSLLSVALFGLMCIVVYRTDLKYSWLSWGYYMGVGWIVATVFLLRKHFYSIPEENRYRISAHTFFALSIAGGLFGINDYVHHATSTYLHCKSITRDNIGNAEFIMSEEGITLMDNCRGYDVYASAHRGTDNYSAYMVTPVENSQGVYVAGNVDGGSYSNKWKGHDALEDNYHEARTNLRHNVPNYQFDLECRTYQRIFPYNNGSYSKYINAVENSSTLVHDSLYQVETLPPIIEPIHDVGLGADARPHPLFITWYLIIHFFICVGLFMADSED